MSGVDTRPVPVNILRWPKTRDLITQHKFIYVSLYFTGDTKSCGCYLLGIESLAADLSMTASSLDDALSEFKRRGLIEFDNETGEIYVVDWPRWHNYKTPAAVGALKASLDKIQSKKLGITVKNAYESILRDWKGKDKVKAKTSSKEEEPDATNQEPKQPRLSAAGIRIWTDQDEQQVQRIENAYTAEQIKNAVTVLTEQGKDPLPMRVSRLLSSARDSWLLPDGWWSSEASTKAAGRTLGLEPRIGELAQEFRERIRSEAQRRQGTS
jgi:hypothetical protein